MQGEREPPAQAGPSNGGAHATEQSCGLRKRSVMIAGHRTSVSLENAFWAALREIAERRGQSVQAVIGAVDAERGGHNLSSAIRVFVLAAYRAG